MLRESQHGVSNPHEVQIQSGAQTLKFHLSLMTLYICDSYTAGFKSLLLVGLLDINLRYSPNKLSIQVKLHCQCFCSLLQGSSME